MSTLQCIMATLAGMLTAYLGYLGVRHIVSKQLYLVTQIIIFVAGLTQILSVNASKEENSILSNNIENVNNTIKTKINMFEQETMQLSLKILSYVSKEIDNIKLIDDVSQRQKQVMLIVDYYNKNYANDVDSIYKKYSANSASKHVHVGAVASSVSDVLENSAYILEVAGIKNSFLVRQEVDAIKSKLEGLEKSPNKNDFPNEKVVYLQEIAQPQNKGLDEQVKIQELSDTTGKYLLLTNNIIQGVYNKHSERQRLDTDFDNDYLVGMIDVNRDIYVFGIHGTVVKCKKPYFPHKTIRSGRSNFIAEKATIKNQTISVYYNDGLVDTFVDETILPE